MSQRLARVAGEVRRILGEVVARDEIKDPRVRGAGIITFTHVRVTGDLRSAHAFFTVHGADDATLQRVRQGLASASAYLRRRVGDELRMRVTPQLRFEIDRVFEQEAKVDSILRALADERVESKK